MHTININEFENYDAKAIYAYIMLHGAEEYKIIFPKETTKPAGDNFDIFWEYHLAAIIGQKLFEIADTFAYYVPSIYKRQPFSFDITIKDLEKLVDTLDFIITGIFETDVDITIQFHDEATRLFTEAFENEELLVACWGLIEIANRHID
jgi:hypothetical protein